MVDKKEEKYGYPKEKIDLITSSSIEELMQLLNEITLSKARTRLNEEILCKFVAPKYKNEKDNSKKFGKETKENYCKAIRGELEGFFGTRKTKEIKSTQDVALAAFMRVVKLWCASNTEINKLDLESSEFDFQIIMNAALKEHVSKETLDTLYKFSTITLNKKIEKAIETAPYRLALLNKEQEKDDRDEKIKKLDSKVVELEVELKDKKQKLEKYSDYDKIKEELKNKEKEIKQYSDYQKIKAERDNLKMELDSKNKELSQYSNYNEIKEQANQYVELKNEYAELKQEKEEIEREKNALEKDFEDLEKLFDNDNNEQILELKEKYEELKKDHNELMRKKTPSGDIKKAKENFERQLEEKDKKIQELENKIEDDRQKIEDIDEIYRKYKELKKRECDIKDDLKSAIEKDEDFRKNLKRIILADEPFCRILAKKMDLEPSIYETVTKRLEEHKLKIFQMQNNTITNMTINESDAVSEQQEYAYNAKVSVPYDDYNSDEEYFRYPSKLKLLSKENEEQFKQEFFLLIEGQDEYKNDLYNKMQKDFVILNNKKELKCWLKAQHYDFEPLVVVPQLDWISYKDWFGHFEDDKFIREATLASDYYKFLENNSTIPLGIIVFQDFNNAIPAYIEPFITELITNKEVRLGHKSKIVNPKDETFKTIKMLPNLKFVFIKSQSDNAFNIPESMKKYEVMNV